MGDRPSGSSRALRLDPYALPVRYAAHDSGADGQVRDIEDFGFFTVFGVVVSEIFGEVENGDFGFGSVPLHLVFFRGTLHRGRVHVDGKRKEWQERVIQLFCE